MVREWKDLSVLIAGCGSIGKRHARVLRGLGVRDIRASDPAAEQAAALARETPVQLLPSFEAGLASQPDTVFLCTPPKLHISMAIQAVENGAHVFCEKPLSDTSAGIDELAAVSLRRGRAVMTGLCFRYHDGLLKARQLLDSGRFGRLVSIRCLMGEHFPTVRPDYRTLFTSKYSGAFDLSHEVDLAVWYGGRLPRNVHCIAGTFSGIGIEAPDLAEILLEFEQGPVAAIHLDFFQKPRRRQTELICTEGVITVEFARWDRCLLSYYEGTEWTHAEMVTDRDDMFRAEDREFLSAVATGQPVACGIDEARKSVEIIERAQASARVPASAAV